MTRARGSSLIRSEASIHHLYLERRVLKEVNEAEVDSHSVRDRVDEAGIGERSLWREERTIVLLAADSQ